MEKNVLRLYPKGFLATENNRNDQQTQNFSLRKLNGSAALTS